VQRGVAAKSILFGDRVGRAACWVLGSGSRLRQQVDSCSLCAHFPDIHGLASAATGLGLGTSPHPFRNVFTSVQRDGYCLVFWRLKSRLWPASRLRGD
jgi:hypothetical protein